MVERERERERGSERGDRGGESSEKDRAIERDTMIRHMSGWVIGGIVLSGIVQERRVRAKPQEKRVDRYCDRNKDTSYNITHSGTIEKRGNTNNIH